MHASHELASPPPDGPSRWRNTRGGKVVAVTLALFVMMLATFSLVTAHPTEARAQAVIATLTGTCNATDTTKADFSLSMPNPQTTAFFFYYRLTPNTSPDLDGVLDGEGNVAAGQTFTSPPMSVAHGGQANWRVFIYNSDGAVVGQSNTLTNPCSGPSPTDPPVVTYDVTCQKNASNAPESVVYALSIRNPNTVAVTYTVERTWDDGRAAVVTADVNVAAGQTVTGGTLNHTSAEGLTAEWTHTLTIKVGDTPVGNAITKENPCATTTTPPTDDPVVDYDVTCQKNSADEPESVVYALSIRNPNTVAVTYTLVRSWDDEREDVVTADVAVGAGETVSGDSVNYTSADGLTEEWEHTLTIKVGDTVVGDPVTEGNPCATTPPTDTTSSTPPGDTTTSTTDIIPAASNSNNNLASTGVAIAAILGAGAVLFANGVGLMRLVRKGGEHE